MNPDRLPGSGRRRIDLIRQVLTPAGIELPRRKARVDRGCAAVGGKPTCVAAAKLGRQSYVDHDYVLAKRIGARACGAKLYAISSKALANRPYLADFIQSCATSALRNWMASNCCLTKRLKLVRINPNKSPAGHGPPG